MNVSDTPWSQFSQSDYSPAQWQRACLIDTEQGDPESKDRYKLPVKEPSGVVNRNGVFAAAERINQVEGVMPEMRAAAARKLVSLYREMGETAPDRLLNEADDGGGQRSAPPIERLFISSFMPKSPLELRAAPDGGKSRHIGGYAAVYNKSSRDLQGFKEIVTPTFFNKSRADGWPGVVCRFNHSDMHLLGATYSRTLLLSSDDFGLLYDVNLPECRGDVLEYVTRGDLAHSSFAFQTYDEEWKPGDGGYPVRMLLSGKLIDVAPVVVPAYPDSTVGLRSLARYVGAPIEDVIARAETDELRSFLVRTDNRGKPKKPTKAKSGRQAAMEIMAMRPEDPIAK